MINRNNYEEYLLLYLDGELEPTERSEVEQFVRSNPDIEAELKILQQTILEPESVCFGDKQVLYRSSHELDDRNYQEWFLLYVDNELTDKQKDKVETFVLQHPELQNELVQLKETVLTPEEIIFPDKKSLYRNTEQKRPVIVLFRWAALAAAAVTGVIAMLIFGGNETAEVANRTKIETMQEEPATPVVKENKFAPPTPNVKENLIAAEIEKMSNKIGSQSYNRQPKTTIEESPVIAYLLPEESQPVIAPPEHEVKTEQRETAIAATGDEKFREKENAVNTSNTAEEDQAIAYAVRNDELDTDQDNSIMIGALQVNPDKVRGFFRKATRFLANKVKDTEDSEGKLKIASMELTKTN